MRRENEIKLIAYKIWEEEGCFDGHDCEHWFRAEGIWEQKQKESVVESTKTESRQIVEQKTKVTGKKRKSKKA